MHDWEEKMTQVPDETPHLGTESDEMAKLPSLADDGTDLTVIRWMLAMSADERLAWLQAHMRSVAAIRRDQPSS